MKTMIVILLAAISITIATAQPTPTYRIPPVSDTLYTNMLYWQNIAKAQIISQDLNVQEGALVKIWYSDYGVTPYFVVQIPGMSDGGTILKMDRITVNDGGVTGPGVYFRDVINSEAYFMNYSFKMDHVEGTFTIAGQKFFVNITYPNYFGIYPSMTLTWGSGASPGKLGNIEDDFTQVSLGDIKPGGMTVKLVPMQGNPDLPDGMYIAVQSPDENSILESSTDLKTWTNEPVADFIVGYVHINFTPKADVVGNKFFRAKK